MYRTNTHQIEGELDALIELIGESGARSFLEIGSKFGGSLWRIARSLPKGSRVVSVELYPPAPLLRCIEALREEGYDAHLIVGNSMDPATIDKVKKRGPYDALFIDGNHKLMYVRSDWERYGPMAKLIAFHDIGWRRAVPASPNRILVPEFWDSIKGDHRHQEILLDPEKNAYGIGVIWR